jgi:hypothetical protein
MDSTATMASYQRRGNHIIDMLPWFLMYVCFHCFDTKASLFLPFFYPENCWKGWGPATHLQSADGFMVAHTVMLSRVQTMNDDVQNKVHVQEMSNVHNCDHQMVAMLLQPRLEHRRQACILSLRSYIAAGGWSMEASIFFDFHGNTLYFEQKQILLYII